MIDCVDCEFYDSENDKCTGHGACLEKPLDLCENCGFYVSGQCVRIGCRFDE